MSETVDKVLDYLGEKPRKSGGNVVAYPGRAKASQAAGAAKAGKGTTIVSHPQRRGRLTGGAPADDAGRAGAVRTHRAPQISSAAVGRLAARLQVDPEVVLGVSDIAARTFHRRQAKQEPLTEAESDRVLRIARVARETERVFGDAAKAGRWLSADHLILGGRPLDLLATDAGARDVEYELVRIDHGDFA